MNIGVTLTQALASPALLGHGLDASPYGREGYRFWLMVSAAVMGEPMTDDQADLFRKHTGRTTLPTAPAKEILLFCGRRSGKTWEAAVLVSYIAAFHDHSSFLAPGQEGVVLLISATQGQAKELFNYVRGLFEGSAELAGMLKPPGEGQTQDQLTLTNGIVIVIATNSYKSVRGKTVVAAVVDELAFMPTGDRAALPDTELLAAIRPALATIPYAMLITSSTPWARRGEVYETYARCYGKDEADTLVIRAESMEANPRVTQEHINKELKKDYVKARTEYFLEWRDDVQSCISRDVVEPRIVADVKERPPVEGIRYTAFVDPSGGRADSMTLAIGHKAGEMIVVDYMAERQPKFSPEDVVAEFVEVLRRYRISTVHGDNYGAAWVATSFARHGVFYKPSKPKSELYRDLIAVLHSKGCELLDGQPKMIDQMCLLERRVSSAGRETIDHPTNGNDDVANSVAGLISTLATKAADVNAICGRYTTAPSYFDPPHPYCGRYGFAR